MIVDAWRVDGYVRARCLICGDGTTDLDSDWLAAHDHPEFTYGDRPDLPEF